MSTDALRVLDGPLGTELATRGVATPLPGWSAHALATAPDVVQAIHADYAAAGATVHTANTFRTKARVFPQTWRDQVQLAVQLARRAVPAGQRLAGSIAPIEDCYRPDLSPAHDDAARTRAEHGELANALVAAGCDLLLVETFPAEHEALLALEAALATGTEAWLALTPGPDAALWTPSQLAAAGRRAVEAGASAVLVNCAPALATERYVAELVQSVAGQVPVGAYANAGHADDRIGWVSAPDDGGGAQRYADLAARWVARGASLVGGCCGTGPAHTRALSRRLGAQDASGS